MGERSKALSCNRTTPGSKPDHERLTRDEEKNQKPDSLSKLNEKPASKPETVSVSEFEQNETRINNEMIQYKDEAIHSIVHEEAAGGLPISSEENNLIRY
ncbi:hypothetical protein EVAR_95980_1 [Eumeta japonica]|uniref:Uncharacterized protein n=1 Tax=Eumeta variegata TaxID=151549 RepID=A0A4C1VB93_EUMVA|nr:hypothetical protein EVAR_95980_1 [Eumeta japonica]